MSNYTSFFLNAKGGLINLECIEISHSSFAEPFRYVRNDTSGITVRHEDGLDYVYDYQLLEIQRSNVTNDIDQAMNITFADMDDTFTKALQSITTTERPTFKYRSYRDDDLTEPMVIIQTLEITSMSKDASGYITFEAKAPELNSVKTGDTYTLDRFPLLRGTL
ncbi:DUF1833 domain-containing protein [Acinetobacter sp. ANC 4779]|uniref:DUF1833 family protein n=1 Tax=Acinetobacter sp. ANC 4779 TaxID=2529848 RepID=UPI001040A4BF|nr:DUF1833 family protein [Acinetobacter sp. ANC 4779]TCB50953.1 DUF1833 domain-containing protein [Acinetobacter sp. ANC 4779]